MQMSKGQQFGTLHNMKKQKKAAEKMKDRLGNSETKRVTSVPVFSFQL